jgi:hypothetical protein
MGIVRQNFGKTVTLSRAGQQESLVNVVDDDDQGSIWTVSLRAVGIQTFVGCRARVDFGNDGFQASTLVDFIDGCVFSVACGFLRITAIAPVGVPGGWQVSVGASAVKGVGCISPLPTLSLEPFSVLAGGVTNLPENPPSYTRELKVFTQDPQNDSFQIRMFTTMGPAYVIYTPAGATMGWTELPANLTLIRVENTGPNQISCFVVCKVKLA